MLQVHRISPARHRAGLRLAALSIVAAGFASYALGAAPGAAAADPGVQVMTDLEVDVDAHGPFMARLLTQTSQVATLRLDVGAAKGAPVVPVVPVEIGYKVTRVDGSGLQIDASLREGDPLVAIASPRLLTHDGQAATVHVKTADGAHDVAVSFVPHVIDAAASGGLPGLPALPAPSSLPALPTVSSLPSPAALPPLPKLSALPPPPAPPQAQRAL